MIKPYNKDAKSILDFYKTTKQGLSTKEAQIRLAKNGPNELKKAKKKSKIAMFFAQFKDLMLIILMVAALVTGIIAIATKNYADLIDVGVILAIVILNAIIGFIQSNKAENALNSLKKMSQPFTKVYRDGELIEIPTTEVVVGDIMYLEAGDVACADCYLIESFSLKADESSLTGEANEVSKIADKILPEDTVLGDRVNMIFSGCVVAYGRGLGVVTATAMDTEIGKIAGLLDIQEEKITPIQQKLNKLSKWITFAILTIALVIFIINVVIKDSSDILGALMVAIALAVAAIPESLPAVITVIMASGVSRMSKQRAIVRKMHAVETLGSCQIICTDKTGTLTQNKMTLQGVYTNGIQYKKNELKNFHNPELIKCMLLCNDSIEKSKKIVGDPTETALVSGAKLLGYNFKKIKSENPRIAELPFDSTRKMMSTFNKSYGEIIAYTKGAPDVVLNRCTHILLNGEIKNLTPTLLSKINTILENFAGNGLRTLAFAYKVHKNKTYTLNDENKMIFLGITALRDPPRPTTKQAVATCVQAGIKPIMITGDHLITAREIAREVGIYKDGDMVLTGQELDKLNDIEFQNIIKKVTVYARVSPQNKVRIVQGWQKTGAVVAMTGDGVNDAPSIKTADIGIGMGQTGTEVTKEVADIVLTDDNFATIVGAVSEGRTIYTNIKKVIQFLFGTNMVEVLALLLVTLISPTLGFLSAMQILFINLITDALPALSLSVEKAEKDIMKMPPRDKKEPLFAHIWGTMIVQIIWQTAVVLGAFYVTMHLTGDNVLATTIAFAILSLSQVFHLCNVRTFHSIFASNPFYNKFFWITMFVCVTLNVLLIAIAPVASVFGLAPLTFIQWLIVFALALTIIPIVELYKLIQKSYLIGKYKKSLKNQIKK